MASSRYIPAACTAAAILMIAGMAHGEDAAPKPAAAKPKEARIAFANEGGIRDWQADGDRGIWVQDNHKHWYYGKFMSPCTGLQFVYAVRFRTGAAGELDRFGAVRARDTGNCTFTSFTESEAPPRKAGKKPADKPGAKAPEAAPAPAAPAPQATPPGGG